jgi:hypothetical protein
VNKGRIFCIQLGILLVVIPPLRSAGVFSHEVAYPRRSSQREPQFTQWERVGAAGMLVSGFGWIAPFFRFKVAAQAIELTNVTEYGLAAYLDTHNHARIWRVAEALQPGVRDI